MRQEYIYWVEILLWLGTMESEEDVLLRREVRYSWGAHSTMESVLDSHPAAPGWILGVPEDLFLTEINSLNVAEINRQHCTAQCRSLIMLIGPI